MWPLCRVGCAGAVAGTLGWAVAGLLPVAASAQDTAAVAPGVELGMLYESVAPPTLVVRPFRGGGAASAVDAIVARDLQLSDRFHVLEAPVLLAEGPPDFRAWDGLGVNYVVDGEVVEGPGGATLRMTVFDIVYARVLERGSVPLPPTGSAGFRLAVHRASDQVVRWITGEPGMAASRIAFMLRRDDGGMDLMVVDSDGEGARRLGGTDLVAYSPAWSPDGTRIVHVEMAEDGSYRLMERSTATGAARDLTPASGLYLTPAYTPDGTRITVALSSGAREDLYDLDPGAGAFRLVQPRAMSPGYSADGRYLAFGSDRLGRPHVWVVDRESDDGPVLVTPLGTADPADFQDADWSPTGPVLALHGGTGLNYQVLVMDMSEERPRIRQLTRDGWSESPSWAPDGRHLVVHGVRGGQPGLYVLDTRTGGTRLLYAGAGVRTPDWSPSLEPPSG